MSSDTLNGNTMSEYGPSGRIPASPFEIQATKALLNKRIEAGEISQKDLDLLKSSYRLVSTAAFVGSSLLGVGSYFFMRRRYPRFGLGMRLFVGGTMGMVGSFIGFTVGGVAGAMEVNSKMEDAPRKLQMFAEIAAESRSAVQDQSLNHVGRFLERDPNEPPPPTRNSMPTAFPPAHTNGPAVFDNSSDQELQDEADRVKGMRGDPMVGEVNMFSGQRGMNEAKGAWERLRNVNRLRSGEHPAIDGAAAPAESERTKEQREFDEMLEKERLGGGDQDWK